MNTLNIINEIITNGYRDETLDLLSLIAIFCGILVLISKNPIVSVLFLIGLFLSLACYLIMLGLSFIGLSYLLVYIGAVSILFIFILMLINIRISELLSATSNSIPLGMFIIIAFIFSVNETIFYSLKTYTINTISTNLYIGIYIKDLLAKWFSFYNNSSLIPYVTSKSWDGNLLETTHITTIGSIMYTSYSIWLIITSIILLLAMVGAIVITIKQKN